MRQGEFRNVLALFRRNRGKTMNNSPLVYNKLVRDKVPDNIATDGKRAIVTIVSGEELHAAMRRKIVEEANELSQAKTKEEVVEEIGDLLEIIAAYRKQMDISAHDVQAVMTRKLAKSGGFVQGKFLISVSEDSIADMVRRRV